MPLKAEGEFALVRKYLAEALSRTADINPDILFYTLLVDSAAIEEDRERLEEHAPWLAKESKRHDHKLFQAVALRAQAVADRLNGKYKQAQEHLKEAKAIFQAMDTTWQLGRTHHEFGQLAIAQDNPSKAKHQFEQAIKLFNEMDALPDLERTQAALKAVTS